MVCKINDNKQNIIDGESLVDVKLPPKKFCVQPLLCEGVTILGGALKISKRWLVQDICIHIAKDEPLWNLATRKRIIIYPGLENPCI